MNVLVLHDPNNIPKRLALPPKSENRLTRVSTYYPGAWDAVMHWGNPTAWSGSPDVPVLNPPEALERLRDPQYMREILRAHGMDTRFFEPATGKRVKFRARYRLHICDLRIIAASRLRGGKYRSIGGLGYRRRAQAIRQTAVLTLYAFGLHFGCVDVGVIGKRHAVPLNIDPCPKLTKRTGRMYALGVVAAAQRRAEWARRERPNVLLGADLEFIMKRSGGGILYASRYFRKHGRVGYDQQGSHRTRGAHPIVEIRPAPTEDPLELVERIKELLRRAARRTPKAKVKWHAGSLPVRGYPIGGHIHISRIDLTTELMRALDNYLALPVMMLEDPKRARRRRPKYGQLGEFRWQSYGGFEYRTLSSWIVAPEFARAVVCLAKLVLDNYESLRHNFMTSPELIRAFYRSDKVALRPTFETVWADLERLPDYQAMAEHLEVIPKSVRSEQLWTETRDLRLPWGLVPPRKRRIRRR